MGHKRFYLSESDKQLLETKLSGIHPSEFGEMVQLIKPGTPILKVECAYEIKAEPNARDKWIRCCICGRDANHTHGFVVHLPDDQYGTVGRDC